jgi:hypothetical protein
MADTDTRTPTQQADASQPKVSEQERGSRRPQPVGLAFGTAIVALLVSAVLNAQGMHKNASIQPDSPARDVALALTGVLADVTGAIGLSEPRKQIEALVSNSGKDNVTSAIETGPKFVRKTVAPPARRAFTAAHPMELYAGGDSLSLETAAALSASAPKTGVINMAQPDGHLSTGLIRPDNFNWFDRANEVEQTINPDVSVLVFGGNDNDDYMTGLAGGVTIGSFGSPTWSAEYGRRVGLVMDSLTRRPGQLLIWVGAPVAQDAKLDSQMKVLNSIYKAEAAKRPGSVLYVDPDPIFAPNGSYQTSINWKGSQVVVREPDGQHLNEEGGVVLADYIMDLLKKRYNLGKGQQAIAPSGAQTGAPTTP